MNEKKLLIASIIIFVLVAVMALGIILSKGTIFGMRLVSLTNAEAEKASKVELEMSFAKEFISAKGEEVSPEVTADGLILSEGFELVSDNEEVAKIVDNKVVGVSEGKANITVKYDGAEATAKVKVIVPMTKMTFTSTRSSIRVGKDLQMKLQMQPSNASVDPITYTSSDESVATVNQNGIVTGVSKGTVTITVHDEYTDTTKTVKLTVK